MSRIEMRNTGEIVKVWEIVDIALKSNCPACRSPVAARR